LYFIFEKYNILLKYKFRRFVSKQTYMEVATHWLHEKIMTNSMTGCRENAAPEAEGFLSLK
jgi:hypothetical protein